MKPAHAAVALYALLAALVVPVYPHFPSPNEFTRWALVAAVVDDHTIEVSRTAAILGPQFEDLAVVDGRVYSNKAPGAALVAAPGYLLVRPFTGPPSRTNLRVALTAMRWCGATLPLLLLALAFARRDAFTTVALLFATPLFAYGLLLFSHALVAAALFGAFLLLERRPFAAGALLGIAVASEYPIVIPALILFAFAPWRSWWKVALGGAPFAFFLALYHKAAFGGVFELPSAHEKLPAFRELAQSGVFGVHAPSASTFLAMLVDPARGLLLFAPIVLAGVVALKHVPAKQRLTLILVPLSIVAVYSGYPNWHGGWAVGPRYVVSAIPFLLFPLTYAKQRIAPLLLGIGAATVVPLTLTFPFPDKSILLPWANLAWPLLRHGLVAPNLLHLVARPLAIAVPFAIVAAALALTKRPLAAAGVAVVIAISAFATRPTPIAAYIEQVYFERGGAFTKTARAQRDLTLPPPSWPF
ncbi:MAG TPA: hypothetical protein VJZ76_04325 [Thermoanaerobaculia bacterium]|nr:hypothetical protein [Thermoanaerobaculia bacterium]